MPYVEPLSEAGTPLAVFLRILLDDLQWADWSREGQLLVATRAGRLQIRNLEGDSREILFEVDLSNLEPIPMPAPASAQRW